MQGTWSVSIREFCGAYEEYAPIAVQIYRDKGQGGVTTFSRERSP